MKGENRALLFLLSMGMELSYLYACSTFLTTSIFDRPFPFPEAVGSFALAALLTLFSDGRGWRIIYFLGLQAVGFLPALLRIIHVFNSWSDSFLNQTWAAQYFFESVTGWFMFLLISFWAFVFWGGGMRLARRPRNYLTICSRCNRGLIAFFALYLTKSIMKVAGGIEIGEPVSGFLIFPFLIFSLLAIGLVQNRSAGPRDFLPGYRGIGVILGFTLVILLVGAGLVLFCWPYLTLAAEAGHGILKAAAGPVGSILVKVFYLIFGHDIDLSQKPKPEKEGEMPDLTSPRTLAGWLEHLEKILFYAIFVILGLLLLVVVGVTLYYLYRWLLSKTEVSKEKQSPRHLVSVLVEQLRLFLHSCWRWLLHRIKGYRGAIQLYTALLSWGRHNGLSHIPSETPTEYGFRLKHRFPALKKEIELIIEAFNETVYGEIILNRQQLGITQLAWRRLRSPLNWPSRLKAWFSRSVD